MEPCMYRVFLRLKSHTLLVLTTLLFKLTEFIYSLVTYMLDHSTYIRKIDQPKIYLFRRKLDNKMDCGNVRPNISSIFSI